MVLNLLQIFCRVTFSLSVLVLGSSVVITTESLPIGSISSPVVPFAFVTFVNFSDIPFFPLDTVEDSDTMMFFFQFMVTSTQLSSFFFFVSSHIRCCPTHSLSFAITLQLHFLYSLHLFLCIFDFSISSRRFSATDLILTLGRFLLFLQLVFL